MITAKQIFNDLNQAQKAKVLDYLRTNGTSKRIFRVDFKEAFYEDLLRRRDGQLAQHLIVNTWGETGCLSGDTILKGQTRTLRQIGDGKIINTVSVDLKTGKKITSKSKVHFSGKKKAYRIYLEDGRFVDATIDHKFFVRKVGKIVEKNLGELTVGSRLVTDDGYI